MCLMDEVSVTRPSPPSTKAIVANEDFCRQVAALLLCDRGPYPRRLRRRAGRGGAGDGPVGPLPRGRRGLRHRRGARLLGEEEGTGGVERQAPAPRAGSLRGAGQGTRNLLEGASGGAYHPPGPRRG